MLHSFTYKRKNSLIHCAYFYYQFVLQTLFPAFPPDSIKALRWDHLQPNHVRAYYPPSLMYSAFLVVSLSEDSLLKNFLHYLEILPHDCRERARPRHPAHSKNF